MTPKPDRKGDDGHFIREAAVALLARDALIGHDSQTVEDAVKWARGLYVMCHDAEHEGDCTKQPFTCGRCVVDEALREAREIHDN